jgi:hypothetical protein
MARLEELTFVMAWRSLNRALLILAGLRTANDNHKLMRIFLSGKLLAEGLKPNHVYETALRSRWRVQCLTI